MLSLNLLHHICSVESGKDQSLLSGAPPDWKLDVGLLGSTLMILSTVVSLTLATMRVHGRRAPVWADHVSTAICV